MKKDFLVLRLDVARIIPLRHKVLRPGLPLESASFTGDTETTTYHFGAFDPKNSSLPVSCVSYMKTPFGSEEAYQLRGMATQEDQRGTGAGGALVQAAEARIMADTGICLFWCNARVEACVFYEKQGWEYASDVFNIPGVGDHRKMIKRY